MHESINGVSMTIHNKIFTRSRSKQLAIRFSRIIQVALHKAYMGMSYIHNQI